MKIIRNAIQCLKCSEVIVSKHVHDFKWCKCGSVAVDGGLDYCKRVGDNADWQEACFYAIGDGGRHDDKLDGKFILYSPSGETNPSVAFDRREDANRAVEGMFKAGTQATFYVAMLCYVV